MMTNVGVNDLVARVRSLQSGRARKEASEAELSAVKFVNDPSFGSALKFLEHLKEASGVRVHRPTLFRALTSSLSVCIYNKQISLYDAAIQVREQNRMIGRPLPRRAIGSTLLLKGLEADIAVILTTDQMNAPNLYVAMTRGSRQLKICSREPILHRK